MELNDSASTALFSNHLILKIIFRNVKNFYDLCSARRVCKIWQREARPFVEPRALVTIEWEAKYLTSLYQRKCSNPTIAEFMDYVDVVSPQNVLFHNFILIDWNKSANFQFISQQFWETCGALIKSLKIDKLWISPFEEDILPGILFEYTPNMESLDFRCNLKIQVPLTGRSMKYLTGSSFSPYVEEPSLGFGLEEVNMTMTVDTTMPRNLNMKSITYTDRALFKQINWGQIIYSYPCLEELVILPRNLTTYLKAICEVKKAYPECLVNLENLHTFHKFDDKLTDEHYRMLVELDIPTLTSLVVTLHGEISFASAHNLLSKWKTSLKNLTLNGLETWSDEEDQDVWATMSAFTPLLSMGFVNLVYLKVIVHILPFSFDFLQTIPQLKRLDITYFWRIICFETVLEHTSEDFCHELFKNIIINDVPYEVPRELKPKVKKFFPNFIFCNEKCVDDVKAGDDSSSELDSF